MQRFQPHDAHSLGLREESIYALLCCMGRIGWMVDPVMDPDIGDFEWVNTLQATNIETVFLRV